jgi:hypothetical protein
MDSKKYIGMDVHKESISITVMNGAGTNQMASLLESIVVWGTLLRTRWGPAPVARSLCPGQKTRAMR